MRKRELHHIWVKIRKISYWYFLIGFVISGSVAIIALRDNNLTAINLRNQLISVDQKDGDVSAALNNLRQYVYSHMNANLASGPDAIYPPIQLKYTYERLEAVQQATINAENAHVYTDAENYCQEIIPIGFSGRYRVPCIETYVTTHGAKAQPIPAGLYEFDFVSPFWSPDLAGWSIVVSAMFLLLFLVRIILEKWLKHSLNEHS